MSILNLETLLEGEPISELVEKINANFSQLSTNGGGPQGGRGTQGTPGLPGLRGTSGPSGDNGVNGKVITIVDDDPNWGVTYTGSKTTNTDASAAITAGFSVGDIWIDNQGGAFYDIHETSPGVYVFVAHSISPDTLGSGELWESDINANTATDGSDQGVRMKSKWASLSLTGNEPVIPPPNPGDSANYGEAAFNNTHIFGYHRAAFKLSIDQTNEDFGSARVNYSILSDTNNLIYGIERKEFSPILYLDTTNLGTGPGDKGFGFLHTFKTDSGGNDIGVLALSSVDELTEFVIDVQKVNLTSNALIFVSKTNSDNNKALTLSDRLSTGVIDTGISNNLWMTISSKDDGGAASVLTDDIYHMMGMRLQKSASDEGIVEIYTHNRMVEGGASRPLIPYSVGVQGDTKLRLTESSSWITQSTTIGNVGFFEGGTAPINGLSVQGKTTIGTTTSLPNSLFPYQYNLQWAAGASKLTIQGDYGSKFAFVDNDGGSNNLVFINDEFSSWISAAGNQNALVLGVDKAISSGSDLIFKGQHLTINNIGNVMLGIPDHLKGPEEMAMWDQRLVIVGSENYGYDHEYGLQVVGFTNIAGTQDRNKGFSFRIDVNNNGQIHQGEVGNVSMSNQTGTHLRMQQAGQFRLTAHRNHSSDSLANYGNVLGEATLEIMGHGGGTYENAVSIGAASHTSIFNVFTPTGVYSKMAGWIGHNATVTSAGRVRFKNIPGSADNSKGSGNFVFSDQYAGYHICTFSSDTHTPITRVLSPGYVAPPPPT